MKKENILADKYLPTEINGSVKVVQTFFKLKKVNNNKNLVGVVNLKLHCKLSIDNKSIEPLNFEKSFEISQNELDNLLPKFVQNAFLEDRVIGFSTKT